MSHPQALAQVEEYLRRTQKKKIIEYDTAGKRCCHWHQSHCALLNITVGMRRIGQDHSSKAAAEHGGSGE